MTLEKMLKAMFNNVLSFFRRQSDNFKFLLVRGILVGGGWRSGIIRALTRQYTSLYIVALGASKVQLGLLQSIGTAVRIILSIPIGQIIDKTQHLKRLLLYGMILGFFSPLIYALATNWYMLIPVAIIMSISWPLSGTINQIILTDSLREEDRATGFSVLRTISAIPGMFLPLLSAYLVEAFGGINLEGIRPLFYIEFVLLVPVSIWVFLKIKVPKRKPSRKTLSVLDSLKKFLVLDRGARAWIAVWILDSFGMLAFPLVTVYAVEVKGADAATLALMSIVGTIAGIIFTIPYGKLADTIGRKPTLYLGLIPTFAYYIILMYSPSREWLVLAGFLGGAYFATFPLWETISMELVPEHLRGSYSGIRSMMTGIASIGASILGGILWETLGPQSIFIACLAFESVAIVVSIAVPETLRKKDTPSLNVNE